MNASVKITNILFLDIETVPQYPTRGAVPPEKFKLWRKKEQSLSANPNKDLYNRAGIYAEFGKIVCISCGYLVKEKSTFQIRLKSFYGDNEVEILQSFIQLVNTHFNKNSHYLCAHNGKEFDFPYIARRILINKLSLPKCLNLAGKKPWEIRHLDTLELWKFGDYKHYTSLELLCDVLDVESPKNDIDGSQVVHVYWKEKDCKRIAQYCVNDVIATIQVYLSYKAQNQITKENIIITD